MPRTLAGRLTLVQAAIVTATCLLMVAATLLQGTLLLRARQDDGLSRLARADARAIRQEHDEDGGTLASAAGTFWTGAGTSGLVLELLDGDGRVVAASGSVPGWPTSDVSASPRGRCVTLDPPGSGLDDLRVCHEVLDADHAIRIIAPDAMANDQVRDSIAAVLLALPAALLVGIALTLFATRRRLSPLNRLRDAAAQLDARSPPRLGVGCEESELKDLEATLDGLLARLRASLDLERQFTAEASHELRTPLTTLRLLLDSLADDSLDARETREAVSQARRDLGGLERLVDALFVLTRAEQGPLTGDLVNASDVAREEASRRDALDGDSAPPIQVDAPDEILVVGSHELLGRLVANLLENARTHAGKGSRIRITLETRGARMAIRVDDDGPGLPDSIQEMAFHRFVRGTETRGLGPGSGLGLAVVKAIAVRHGGDARACASALGGACIDVDLPLAKGFAGG